MGIISLMIGVISTFWALLGGKWFAILLGLCGVVLALIGIRRKAVGASVGLMLSINGVAWGLIYMVSVNAIDPLADLFGLG